MKLLLLLVLSLWVGWATAAAAAGRRGHRQVQQQTTTTTQLLPDLLSAEMMIIDDATKLQATVTYQGVVSYVALAFSLDQFMAGSFAVIGLPAVGTVLKYQMDGRFTPTLLSDDRQTLTDTSVTSDGIITTMTFTKLLTEVDEVPINPNGDNIFLYAVGPETAPAGTLQFHTARGDVTVNFVTGATAVSDPNEYRTLWVCHGILLAVAWLILIPMGTACSIARSLVPSSAPSGRWFALHRSLNMCGVLLTVIGFALAVYIINQEQGDTAQHFTAKPHYQIGLAVFLVAILNALLGIFRPPAPHAPAPAVDDDKNNKNNYEEDVDNAAAPQDSNNNPPHKTPARVAFEYGHRVLGLSAILLAWFNVGSGAELIHGKYSDDIPDLSLASWIIVAIIAALTLVLGVVSRSKQ